MSAGSATAAARGVSTPVDQYLHYSLYLMVVTGFGTLAATGQLDFPTVLLVTLALALRGYVLLAHKQLVLAERSAQFLALGYAAFYLVDLFFLSRAFLPATVHLVLFGMVAKVFSAHRSRDHVFLAILSFAMILAAAVLTVQSAFFFAFSLFLLVAVAAFILMEMQRSYLSADRPVSMTELRSNLVLQVGGAAPLLLALILAFGTAIFFLLPRFSAGYLGSYNPQNDISTGFSSEVRLGRIGQIQQSNAVVMHAEIEGDSTGAHDLRWRGIALWVFDGKKWSNPSTQIVLQRSPEGRFILPSASSALEENARPGTRISYRVLLEPLGTNVFFLADRPYSVSGTYNIVTSDSTGAVYSLDRQRTIRAYSGESLLPNGEMNPSDTNSAAADYLQLPRLDPRIPRLAREITDQASDDQRRAEALERYLSARYGYTLAMPQTAPADPLAHFLFERKRGHCEYFASAMAVMLRSLGIPSRVVNGFRAGEFNDVSGQYIIRARDAHSWVEAYLPERGWVAFDPTPAGALTPHSRWNRALLYIDALSSFWQEWIINYDLHHQRSLRQDALRQTRSVAGRIQTGTKNWYERLLGAARKISHSGRESARGWAFGAAALAMLVILLANTGRLLGWWHTAVWNRTVRAPKQAASLWYERLARWLGHRGWRREGQQTAEEFAEKIRDDELRISVQDFARHYERARFGGSREDAERLPELYEEITTKPR